LAVFRRFPCKKVLPYFAVQVAGAFCGAALVFLNYRPQFLLIDPGLEKTGVFSRRRVFSIR
jgi:glycerol uptake facilitator protein